MYHSLITRLYQIKAIQFGAFKLKSGENSSIYINLRKIISYPDLLRMIAETMWQTVREDSFDVICGVPYTALPIATCISLDHNIPMVMRRKEKKDYGTKQSIEGVWEEKQSCLLIEDVITTGGSILETALDLEQNGLYVPHVVALIDREQGGKKTLEEKFKVHTILSLSTLLQGLLQLNIVTDNERPLIEEFMENHFK